MKISHLVIIASVLGSCSFAHAVTASINFTGNVASTCSLMVTNGAGTLAPSATLGSLSSKNAGGVAGTVSVATTGGVNLSVDPVTSPTQPVADLSSTVWLPSYSMTGAQTVADTSAITALTSAGSSNMRVDLTATKVGSDTFKQGGYGATVTIRCEP